MQPETLADHVTIQNVMIEYAAAVDERDLQRYRNCFADNVEVVNFGTRTFHGLDEWSGYVWTALEKYRATQHMLGPSLIKIDGDSAEVRTDVQARHWLKEEQVETFTLWATYKTRMHRYDDEWKITHHSL